MTSKKSPIENLILIYLDETSGRFESFQSFVNTIQYFSNPDEFRRFVEDIIDEKLFIILSDSFSEPLIREIESKPQVFSIYVYCHGNESDQSWSKDHSKVKGVYKDLPTIFNAFRRDIRQATNDLIPIHINNNPSFICSLLLKQILLNTPSTDQMKNDFIESARSYYQNNPVQLNLIDQYEKTDYNQITAIEWYTRECFISSMIHRALKFYDIEILNQIGFFIRDLNKQIEDLHAKSTDSKNLSVFYGQGISNEQLQIFRMTIDGLISFNSFLLTTIDKEISRGYAKQSNNDISILYRIEIDRSKSSTAFVLLNQFDYYQDTDQYILFSLNSTFRIHHIECLEGNFWQMNLILVDPNEPQLKNLIKPKQISNGFFSIGKLMFEMNDLNTAKNIFQVLLQNTDTINSKQLGSIHGMLGRIYQKHKDITSALFHYQESMKTKSTSLSPNDPSLALTLASIGAILEKLGDLNQALEYYKRAADNQKIDPSNLVFFYSSIGRILFKQGESVEARKNFELALKFEEKSSISNTKFLAEIHHYLTMLS